MNTRYPLLSGTARGSRRDKPRAKVWLGRERKKRVRSSKGCCRSFTGMDGPDAAVRIVFDSRDYCRTRAAASIARRSSVAKESRLRRGRVGAPTNRSAPPTAHVECRSRFNPRQARSLGRRCRARRPAFHARHSGLKPLKDSRGHDRGIDARQAGAAKFGSERMDWAQAHGRGRLAGMAQSIC